LGGGGGAYSREISPKKEGYHDGGTKKRGGILPSLERTLRRGRLRDEEKRVGALSGSNEIGGELKEDFNHSRKREEIGGRVIRRRGPQGIVKIWRKKNQTRGGECSIPRGSLVKGEKRRRTEDWRSRRKKKRVPPNYLGECCEARNK